MQYGVLLGRQLAVLCICRRLVPDHPGWLLPATANAAHAEAPQNIAANRGMIARGQRQVFSRLRCYKPAAKPKAGARAASLSPRRAARFLRLNAAGRRHSIHPAKYAEIDLSLVPFPDKICSFRI